MDSMLEDTRDIKQISLGDNWWAVGRDAVTKIVVYGENGMHCDLPWFAVYQGDEIVSRVNAAYVTDVWYG